MPPVLFIGLSVAASLACVAASWRYRARIAALSAVDGPAVARAIRDLPGEERLAELARRAPPGSWAHRFAAAVLEAEGQRAKIAAANDLIAEADHRIAIGAGWPAAATRIAAFAALLSAAASFLAGAGVPVLAAILCAGAAGAIASAAAGRAGRIEAERQRRAIDALVAAALGPLAEEPPGPSRAARVGSPGRRRSA